jgi:UDP-N-acetylglucosamine--N-acetylmuramyl-(pentapeptide) pyrophosphoryl-undecaprenol N-acetylglucosamine transferase
MARVLLAGGGTGGHVYPSLAVAEALRDAAPEIDIEFIGTERGLEARAVPEAGWPLTVVEARPLARKASLATLQLPLVLARATGQVTRRIRDGQVRAALVFGGYTSVPLALAALRTRIPLIVHEQNSVPGLANRLAARWARSVAVTFPASVDRFPRPDRVVVTGNPVRPGFSADAGERGREEGLAAFGLERGRRTLLAFGGSQGARRINQALVDAVGRWGAPERLQILHVTGRGGAEAARAAWDAVEHGPLVVRCVDFVDRMELAYAAADVVLCRSGASTLAELTVCGLPSVLVPYPHATDDHQTVNARDLAAAGGAVVVADGDLDGGTLVTACEPLLLDDDRRMAAAEAARRFARPDAAAAVAALVLEAAGQTGKGTP